MKASERPRRPAGRTLLLAPAVILVTAAVLVPTFIALVDSFQNETGWTLSNYASFFLTAPYPQVLLNTLSIAFVVTAVSIVIAAPVAAFLSRESSGIAGT
ncbi:MAG: hypothetical protein ABI024_12685, partial [Vicinamibacterales bacterium]